MKKCNKDNNIISNYLFLSETSNGDRCEKSFMSAVRNEAIRSGSVQCMYICESASAFGRHDCELWGIFPVLGYTEKLPKSNNKYRAANKEAHRPLAAAKQASYGYLCNWL